MRRPVLLLVFAACTGTIDTGGGPAQPPATDVQLTVRDGQSPLADVLVVFQHASGVLAAEVRTDARGVAAAEMPEGGSVTVVRSYPTPPGEDPLPLGVFTYVGVKAGDRLSLGQPASEQGATGAALVSVPPDANGTVKITASCGSGQGNPPQVAIAVRDCGPEIAMYLVDGAGQALFKRMPYAGSMDVSSESLIGGLTSQLSAVNVPPDTTVNVEQRLGSAGFDFVSTGNKRVDQTPANVTLPPLNNVETLVIASISGNNRTQVVATRKAYNQDTTIVDATAGLISSVSELKYNRQTGFTWIEDGAGKPDAVIASLAVTREQTSLEFVRVIIAPHAGPSFQVPALTGSAALYNPIMDDQIGTALGLVKATGGYDSLRPRAFAVESIVDATPMDSVVTLSYTGSPPGL